jgi:hypothetical protein
MHVVHARSGLLAPRGDARQFAALAARLVQDAPMRLSLGRAARNVALEVPWEKKFPELEQALLDAASQPPTSRPSAAARAEARS